jgi:hypothetical protein
MRRPVANWRAADEYIDDAERISPDLALRLTGGTNPG